MDNNSNPFANENIRYTDEKDSQQAGGDDNKLKDNYGSGNIKEEPLIVKKEVKKVELINPKIIRHQALLT